MSFLFELPGYLDTIWVSEFAVKIVQRLDSKIFTLLNDYVDLQLLFQTCVISIYPAYVYMKSQLRANYNSLLV
jgi:hypothetical protein